MELSMTAPHPSPLLEAFDHQDEIFASALLTLQEAITSQAFPAASIAITHYGRLIALKAVGSFIYDARGDIENEGAPPFSRSLREGGDFDVDVTPATLFDLASLTKIVATTPMAMLLYERGLLDLDTPVSAIVPEFTHREAKDPRRHNVTLRMLLAHSSGLPAYEKLFLQAKTRDELLQAVFTMSLAADPATRANYSDIGFILLGIALERLADESLDLFCQREIFAPLAMTSTTFNPPAEIRAQIPPTADERLCGAGAPAREMPAAYQPSSGSPAELRSTFRDRIIQGEVQDENAHTLGGVAPHAGLFSTARDLAQFANVMLNGGYPILRPETVALFTRRESAPPGTTRALGWDTPSLPSQSGKYFSANSYGHLGYTGTSLWIDPTRQLSITLLTNRTWPDCSNHAIKTVRPVFHDAVREALENTA
jgi:CubicO group peptidase (beta-lactamase class C family)